MASITVAVTTIPSKSGDTLITNAYNVYSSITGELPESPMTAAEALTGKTFTITDVDAHGITVKAVWTTAGESTLSSNSINIDAASVSTKLFEDEFIGTTIDTSKWTTVNPGSADIVFSQNGELIMAGDGDSTTGALADYLYSPVFTFGAINIFTFDVLMNDATYLWNAGMIKQATLADDQILFSAAATNNLKLAIKIGAAVIQAATVSYSPSKTVYKTLRIWADTTIIKFQYWGGSSRVDISTTSTALLTGDWSFALFGRSLSGTVSDVRFDNISYTQTDFSTQHPV